MNERDSHVLREFAARVRKEYPTARIWAFGSRARGTANRESDLDVCVVVDEFNADIRMRISAIAWEVGFERDLLISTVVFSTEMFERGRCSVSGIVRNIREEGIAA